MKLSDKTVQAILALQSDYPEKRSALIPALHLAQNEAGYLPEDVQHQVARLFNISPNEVKAVVSFYDMFYEKPVGKHIIHVCKNASCMLRGSDCVLEKMCGKLGIEPHGTTADGQFTVIPSECLAACDKAPMMLVDDKVVGPVNEAMIDQILEEAKKMPGHPSPVSVEVDSHA